MNTIIARGSGLASRLRPLSPFLLAVVALAVAACNNGSGGSGY